MSASSLTSRLLRPPSPAPTEGHPPGEARSPEAALGKARARESKVAAPGPREERISSAALAADAYSPLLEQSDRRRAASPDAALSVPGGARHDEPSSNDTPTGIIALNKLHDESGTRFYGRVRLVMAEELIHSSTDAARRKQIALSRRGQSLAKSGCGATSKFTAKHKSSGRGARASMNRGRQTRSTRRGDASGENDTYDAYPWSAYFRDEVMCLSKIPRPPYFSQLNPGLRPDTLVLRTIPVSWFLDTPEEVAEERAREIRERKVAQYSDTQDSSEPTSDTPLWFTKHGKILIKAACMRFGPVRRVDLVFEMESRN